jgi:hypothetical protein
MDYRQSQRHADRTAKFTALKAAIAALPDDPATGTGWRERHPGAWAGEAEAALAHLAKAREQAPGWHENWTAQKEIAIAIRCLETAINSEPRHSAADRVSDGANH